MERRDDGLETGRSNQSRTQSGSEGADEIRYRTLTRLEALLHLLVDRHGARMTLGEMLAITAAMALFCKQDRVTIGQIAEATGIPKQNISRWATKRIGDSIFLKINEEDQRMHDVAMLDRERGQAHIEQMAELFGILQGTTREEPAEKK
jgi:IS5 family transposase